jgi:hypothetical protein
MLLRLGVVVPTIGERPEYLPLALRSIRDAGPAYILLVGNPGFDPSPFFESDLIDEFQVEETANLAGKINQGFKAVPQDIEYISWLSDDDLLTVGSIEKTLIRMSQPDSPVLVFGACEYIDALGKPIWINKSGFWAVQLLKFGPQLIPQPGSVFSRLAFEKVGGLKTEYALAFDFDLFLSLSKIGKTAYIPEVLAKFRWHSGSLSVKSRKRSVCEASQVRRSHLPIILQRLSTMWETPISFITHYVGIFLSFSRTRSGLCQMMNCQKISNLGE